MQHLLKASALALTAAALCHGARAANARADLQRLAAPATTASAITIETGLQRGHQGRRSGMGTHRAEEQP